MIYPGELFDGGQVGGRPIKSGKVLRDPPGDGLMLQDLGLTGFYGAAVGAERNIKINANIDDVKDEAIQEIEKQLKKMLKKFK